MKDPEIAVWIPTLAADRVYPCPWTPIDGRLQPGFWAESQNVARPPTALTVVVPLRVDVPPSGTVSMASATDAADCVTRAPSCV